MNAPSSTKTTAPRDGRDARWEVHRQERRRELVEHTLRAIRRHGPGVGMDEIALEAGTSKTVLYRHFGDRIGIYVAVVEAVDALILKDLGEVADHAGYAPDGSVADVTGFVTAMVQTYLRLIERDPEIYAFVVSRPLLDPAALDACGSRVDDPVLTLTGRIGDQLSSILTAHLRRNGRNTDPAVTWGHGIVGFIRAAADHWVTHGPSQRSAEDVTSAVLAMLGPALHQAGPDQQRNH
ncbi:TetR/AcrR family transcriptional regulator [Ornithinimicrobium sp. INDO-MA30-4]|uniref:TetR/AcrR family transcriptional regulator n=1 Tax=Ornithinimicrobium sp. INDO-MA30-4 TaxID=2908651 RepID=UPI001F1E10F3|nr:TetR/AcrR family transcriptional regulator [Ornithinimicrobium sp. INDO-MA30-4]UJH69464.1 TetR/AcrR family transcriptional regulator [Ornithinimicrobium sp. INDO-MA30-4]